MSAHPTDFPAEFGSQHFVIYILTEMMAADGKIAEEEVDAIFRCAHAWFGDEDGDATVMPVHRFIASVSGEHRIAMMMAAASHVAKAPESVKRNLLQTLSDLAAIDGHIHPTEKEMLSLLATVWDLN